jgi:hypothetical protein
MSRDSNELHILGVVRTGHFASNVSLPSRTLVSAGTTFSRNIPLLLQQPVGLCLWGYLHHAICHKLGAGHEADVHCVCPFHLLLRRVSGVGEEQA